MASTNQIKNAPKDVKELLEAFMQLDDMLVSCMRCGLCQGVCPVYATTMREADVTRGKISLLENLAHEMTQDAKGVNDRLNRCLLCGSCETNCPSGVKITDIFINARVILTNYIGLSPIKKIIFRGMLKRPALFNSLLSISSLVQGIVLRKANDKVGTSCAPLLSPLIGSRHFPALAGTPMHKTTPSLNTPAGKSGIKVALFPGCVTDKMFPRVGAATLKALENNGVGVFLPEKQGCCGIPSIASGDMESYDVLLKHNLELFGSEEFDYLLTPCATCAATLKEIWPKLMGRNSPDIQKKITSLHPKVMEITTFMVDVLKIEQPVNQSEKGKRVTYHDPCHMRNSLKATAQPRAMLKALPDYTYVEMPAAASCCGSGGSFTIAHYDLSKKIGQRKRDNTIAVNPEIVATTCPACMMQLMDALSQNSDKIEIKHVIELYADSIR